MFTHSAAALPQKKRTQGRRLVVVDLENVIGGAVLDCDVVRWAKRHIADAIAIQPGDHIVVGTSHIGLLATGCTWTNLRYVIGSGPDGADLALLEVLEENIAARFAEVVLVSGDGIFTDKVSDLAGAGVRVTVLAHPDGLAARLRMAAPHVLYLPERFHPRTFGDAA